MNHSARRCSSGTISIPEQQAPDNLGVYEESPLCVVVLNNADSQHSGSRPLTRRLSGIEIGKMRDPVQWRRTLFESHGLVT